MSLVLAITTMQSTIKPNRIRSSSFQKVNTLMFNRKKDVWPSPESSIGKLCPANVSTSGSCWEAVGPARDAFEEVCEDVKLLFQAQCEYLYEGEERASTISYGIWMIGKDRPRAVPTIIIGCESKNVRTKAKDILKGSGLLDAFPGIVIKKTARTPGLLASQNQFSDESSPPGLETVYAFESASENDLCTIQIFLGGPEVPPDPATAPRATMGKFLLIDGKPHGLTVSHVFDSTIATPAAATAPSDGGNLMVFDEDSDSDSSSLADFTSKGNSFSFDLSLKYIC